MQYLIHSNSSDSGIREKYLRSLILLGGVLILSLLVLVPIAGTLLIRNFARVERDDVLRNAQQVYRAFGADALQLDIANRDYAEWNDSAAFARQVSSTYIDANFTVETLSGLHVDLVLVIDPAGAATYSALYDRSSNEIHSPAPDQLLEEFRPFLRAAVSSNTDDLAAHLLQTTRGLTEASAREITSTDRKERTGARLLFARFLGPQDLARISQTSQLSFSLVDLQEPHDSLPTEFERLLQAKGVTASLAVPASNGTISGLMVLRDYRGAGAAVLSTSKPRDIYNLGRQTTWLLLGSIAILSCVFVGLMLQLILRLRRSLRSEEAAAVRLRKIAGQLRELILLLDADTLQIRDANDALLGELRCTSAALRSRTLADLYPELDLHALISRADHASKPIGAKAVASLKRFDKTALPVELTLSTFEADGQRLLCLVATDISHQRQTQQISREYRRRLYYVAYHDSLTGLPNRLCARRRLDKALRGKASSASLTAAVHMDIDNFKAINDSTSHRSGDRLLRAIGKRLRAAVSNSDIVARLSGDEFLAVVSGLPNTEAVEQLLTRLANAIEAPYTIEGNKIAITVSMGAALSPDHGLDPDTLLRHADIALNQAKKSTSRKRQIFSPELGLTASESVALEQGVRAALGTSQFYMEYQPVVDLGNGKYRSLEALVRWQHPDLGLIPPSTFVPVIKRCQLMAEFGNQVLRTILADMQRWAAQGVPPIPVAVNLDPYQVEHTDYANLVRKLAAEHLIDQRLLIFEITETTFLSDTKRVVQALQDLRSAGSKIYIDDFGTGYSGLSYLSQFPVDGLKVDQGFMQDILTNPSKLPIVKAVLELAHGLNLSVVAEGVEVAEQLVVLSEIGCDSAQGYFFGRPLTAAECVPLLTMPSEPTTIAGTTRVDWTQIQRALP